jgi:hypothetical protein
MTAEAPGIGQLNEQPLHAALKAWYARPGDRQEATVDGYVIDVVRGDLLVEIQTGNFAGIKTKVKALVARHPLRLVYPIARERWIVKLPRDGRGAPSRRKSPKRGRVEELFRELVSFPELLAEPNFALEVLFVREEEVRRYDGRRRWRRRGWVTQERRLLDVLERRRFERPADLEPLLAAEMPAPFTTRDLAQSLGQPRWLAQKMAYCLRKAGVIAATGRRGRSVLYERNPRE